MSKLAVVFWSGTGNTETMADAIVEGAEGAGAEVEKIAAYDWGTGDWMETWKERTEGDGAEVVDTVIANLEPDDDALESCKGLGAALA